MISRRAFQNESIRSQLDRLTVKFKESHNGCIDIPYTDLRAISLYSVATSYCCS